MTREVTSHHHPLDDLAKSIRVISDQPDPKAGNGVHEYLAYVKDGNVFPPVELARIQFQHGPRGDPDSIPGITAGTLMAILLDHFQSFQEGPYKCRENALVITALEEAQMWNEKRMVDRYKRGVLGKNEE